MKPDTANSDSHVSFIPSGMATPEYKRLLLQCVHCGLCLESCPTYALFGTEFDSPRGRIELMHAASEGRLDQETFLSVFREHINLCLDCRACEPACPSRVQYGKLVEGARIAIEEIRQPGPIERSIKNFGMGKLMPDPKLFKNFARLFSIYQKSGLQTVVRKVNLLPWRLQGMAELLPPITDSHLEQGTVYPAQGKKRGTVAFFTGCIQEAFLGRINAATVRVLQRNGFEVHIPKQQTCCGAAQWHTGGRDLAVQLARQNIDALLKDEYEAVINNAGGCGLTLKEYPELLHADPVYYEKAIQFAKKVIDFSQFIFDHLLEPPAANLAVRAVYSDSCHLRNGQKVIEAPRSLLKLIPGVELVEMKQPDRCCGSAGIYNVLLPEPANGILDAKMTDIAATGAGVIVTSNTGCHMQLVMGAHRSGLKAHVMHIAEVLDYAYRAETKWTSRPVNQIKPLKHPRQAPSSWLTWQEKRLAPERRSKGFNGLREQFLPGQILEDPTLLYTYERDAAIDRAAPDGVLFALSTNDVQKAVQWCSQNDTPLIARGAGSGLAGNSIAKKGGLILEFSQMKRLLDLDLDGHNVTVEPGMITQVLDDQLKPYGFAYPPDPASGKVSTLGANISLNSGGPRCFKYGVTGNYLLGMEVILADGRLVQFGGKALDAPGYDLAGIMTGSEGMLGVITKATLGIRRRPPAVKTVLVAFDRLEQAGDAVSAIIARGLIPTTLEFMDKRMMEAVELFTSAGLPLEAAAVLLMETDGYAQSVGPQMDEIIDVLKGMGVTDIRIAQNEIEREKLWLARKSCLGAIASVALAEYTTDVTVPRSKMASTLLEINRILEEEDLKVCIMAHTGDGNLHPMILIQDPNDKELIRHIHHTARRICEYCVSIGGSITGEHGVGTEKTEFMALMYSAEELAAMQDIKDVFDPKGLLNPGKVLPNKGEQKHLSEPSKTVMRVSFTPGTTEEAAQTIRHCSTNNLQIRIASSSTVLSGDHQAEPILSTANLDKIITYRPEDLYIQAGAGVRLEELQSILDQDHMWLPAISPWQDTRLGGLAARNMNAPLRMRYGSLRDLILAMTVVLADGRILRMGRPVVKNVAGLDLGKMFIGSQGSLGLITDLTFKITPQPQRRITRAFGVENLSDGLNWAKIIRHETIIGSAILLTHLIPIEGIDTPYTLVYSAEGYPQDVDAFEEILQQKLIGISQPVHLQTTGSEIWANWLGSFNSNEYVFRSGFPAGTEARLLGSFNSTSADGAWLADLYSGILYTSDSESLGKFSLISRELGGYTVKIQGTPQYGTVYETRLSQPQNMDLMKAIKYKWDPQNLFADHSAFE